MNGKFTTMKTFLSDYPWRIELKEIHDLVEDIDRTRLNSRIIVNPERARFELRVWHRDDLVFFMTTDPRAEVNDLPSGVSHGVHVFNRLVEGAFPLFRLLEDANRVKN